MAFNKQKTLEAARKFRDKGQKDKAIREYLKVVKADPQDVRVWLKIGDLYAQKGEKAEATETYEKVAKFYSEKGFYLKAVAVYKQILKLDSRLIEVNLKLAELYRQLGLISDAMQHFEAVAAFFHREGKTKEALATVRQLVDLDPDNVATRIKLAELYSKEEMVEEAVAEFQFACEFLKRNAREDDYVKVAERLLWHKPERTELARELAGLYLKRKDPRRALQKLQACFKADQQDVETLALLAQAFQALEQKGKTVSVLKELARVLADKGQRAEAEEVHRKILAYAPEDAESLEALGRAPKAEAAKAKPKRALSRPPSKPRSTSAKPVAETEQTETLAANLELDEEPSLATGSTASAELHSDEIVKILTETDVYLKYGLHQKAVQHLNRVFDLDPESVEARERLKDIYLAQGRSNDAVAELIKLAEATATSSPDKAEGYIREVLNIDPNHENAIDLARRFRLDVTKALTAAPVEIVDDLSEPIEFDLSSSEVKAQPIDDVLDFDDLDIGASESAVESGGVPPETLDPADFDDLLFQAPFDSASPPAANTEAAEPPPQAVAPAAEAVDDLDFDQAPGELSFDDGIGHARVEDAEPISLDSDEIEEIHDISELGGELLEEEPVSVTQADVAAVDATEEVDASRILGEAPAVGPSLEDELDEADFFIQQGLFDEARDTLSRLHGRYPQNPLVTAKFDELEEAESQQPGSQHTDASASAADHADEISAASDSGDESSKPSVIVGNQVDDADAATHFDLGQAYMEMGLLDEAVKEFEKVLGTGNRAVQCHLMIGLCHRQQNKLSEAITQFKAGLYVPSIEDAEQFGLYYEIASAYEDLSDPQEALYYYEMLQKKDPDYRDVAARVEAIRGGSSEQRAGSLDDDTDAALDGLID